MANIDPEMLIARARLREALDVQDAYLAQVQLRSERIERAVRGGDSQVRLAKLRRRHRAAMEQFEAAGLAVDCAQSAYDAVAVHRG